MADFYTLEPIWRGRTVACIACGPSLTRADCDAVRAAGLPTVAVNNAGIDMAPWADVLYACDEKWWQHHPEARGHPGLKLMLSGEPPAPGIHKLRHGGPHGLADRRDTVKAGITSGYQALNVVYHMGATRILLLGYDMGADDMNCPHYFGRHTKTSNPDSDQMKNWRARMADLAPLLTARGVEVVNCSRRTWLDCFPRATLEDALAAASA